MDQTLAAALQELLGPSGYLTEDLARYQEGWRYGHGRAAAVLRPATPAQLADVVRRCHAAGQVLVPQGANTGLTGASVPDDSGAMVVLSLERLSAIEAIDPIDRTATVQGGVLLSRLQEALAPHGLRFPIDLGADPQVGGMIATNTGGTRLLRYGDVRANLLGVEVVLGDGAVVDGLSSLRKDNTGLRPASLFPGTFGALGVVTRAVLSLSPIPRQQAAALVACPDDGAVLALLRGLEAQLHGLLSAFEVMSAAALAPVFAHTSLRDPYAGHAPAPQTVLVEVDTTLSRERLDLDELLAETLAELMEQGLGLEDVFLGDAEEFWAIRHAISESHRSVGRVMGLDVSVPRSSLPRLREAVSDWLDEAYPYVAMRDFGHWGDGGVHLNLTWDADAPAPAVQERVYALVAALGGSYSAEHGLGPHNQGRYDATAAAPLLRLTGALREACDPGGILGRVRL
ncbi:MAG: FAD-binding oxidoreductase [Deltaproteobacteria bacterium]|nr:FAD-binding oxidoreductase [Deltaproteobacteria bacterium]